MIAFLGRVRTILCCVVPVAASILAAGLAQAQPDPDKRDPHIVEDGRGLEEDRDLISKPTLGKPIYACSTNVTVKNFLAGAEIEVLIDGTPAPVGPVIGHEPALGVNIELGVTLNGGETITAIQRKDGASSDPTDPVPVTSHTEDYPAGLPQPRLFQHPLYSCGRAVLVEDVVPGATVRVISEKATPAGFDPPADVGSFNASTEWGHNWTVVSPRFGEHDRITARAKLCTDQSPLSPPEIVEAAPSPMPPGKLEEPVVEGSTLVNVWGQNGPPSDVLEHGATVRVFDDGALVGETPTPGGTWHILGINPATTASSEYTVTQELCEESKPGEPQRAQPCEALPAAEIAPPLPGDTIIYVTKQAPGAEILVFVNGEEWGHSGGTEINLKDPLPNGAEVRVLQRLGKCTSQLVYVIPVECALADAANSSDACSADWPAFRQSGIRHARQVQSSPLADPYKVKTLKIHRTFDAPDGGGFTASPVVSDGRVFIGSSRGHLYALDANTLDLIWQFPRDGEPPLLSEWSESGGPCANPSSGGIAASVTVTTMERRRVVILGAPDRGRPSDPNGKFHDGLGSGRLFALDFETGDVIWMTGEPVARLTGLNSGSTGEFHEQIGYSSPLVQDGRIYVGIADHCDNPIQNGRVVAVDLFSGGIVNTFSYQSTSDRGGGVWTYVSGGLAGGLVTTTGNTRRGGAPEPAVNHGLSMVRLNPVTGAVEGKLQPVPWALDGDPDWAAGATLVNATCGPQALSTMKDGWAYSANMGPPLSINWQFPSIAYPFPGNDTNDHGDIRYHRPGAGWNDVFIAMMGGEDIVDRDTPHDTFAGYRRLHAVNVCAGPGNRVRWIAELQPYTEEPPAGGSPHYWGLGPPTVTHGIVYIGTNLGFLLAIADSSIWPGQGSRCTWSNLSVADCSAAGFQVVPRPTVLRALDLGAGSLQRTEPALAGGRIYAATAGGRLFMIAPE